MISWKNASELTQLLFYTPTDSLRKLSETNVDVRVDFEFKELATGFKLNVSSYTN
jgi:hypothetical protein